MVVGVEKDHLMKCIILYIIFDFSADVEKDHLKKCIILYIIFDFSADNSQISLDSLSKCLKLVNLSIIIFFCRWEKMLRAKSTRKRVASAVARECAEMSRASVESSKNKKRTRRETTAILDEANPQWFKSGRRYRGDVSRWGLCYRRSG